LGLEARTGESFKLSSDSIVAGFTSRRKVIQARKLGGLIQAPLIQHTRWTLASFITPALPIKTSVEVFRGMLIVDSHGILPFALSLSPPYNIVPFNK
jgi:hypothetical protein